MQTSIPMTRSLLVTALVLVLLPGASALSGGFGAGLSIPDDGSHAAVSVQIRQDGVAEVNETATVPFEALPDDARAKIGAAAAAVRETKETAEEKGVYPTVVTAAVTVLRFSLDATLHAYRTAVDAAIHAYGMALALLFG